MDANMGARKYYMLRPLDYSRHQACSRRREGRLFTQALFTSKKAHGKTGFAWEIFFLFLKSFNKAKPHSGWENRDKSLPFRNFG